MRTDVPSDAALLARIRQGDQGAFSTLVPRYHGSLVRLACGYVASRAIAQEVVQDTWLAVLKGLHRFEGRAAFRTWLFTILANRARTRGEREGRSVSFSAAGADEREGETAVAGSCFDAAGRWRTPPRDWARNTPEASLLEVEANATLESAIASLPGSCRTAVAPRDIEGLTARETCAILEISDGNQRVLLHRARTRLRQALDERDRPPRSVAGALENRSAHPGAPFRGTSRTGNTT